MKNVSVRVMMGRRKKQSDCTSVGCVDHYECRDDSNGFYIIFKNQSKSMKM